MAKLTDRTALVTPADGDFYVTTDISDTTDAATGTDKKITWANIKAGLKTYFDTLYGNVTKVATPVSGQVGYWTGDGTLAGDAHFTFDSATDALHIHKVSGDATDGLILESENGTDVGILGAANTANATWYGSHNFSVATQDTIAGFTGVGKTLGSLATATYPSLTELSYVKGATSAVQTQLGGKVDKSTYDAHSVLYATTDDTPVALTVGEQTVVGRATGGNISAIAIDSDLAGVSANHDTVPSAKATKAYADLMLPLAGGTMSGNITLGENTSLDLDPAGSADGKYSGICITGTAGATLAFGDLIYLAVADSRWELTDADATATAGTPLIGMCVLAAASDGSATKILLQGTIRADAKFPALTVGAPAYVGETAGAIQTAIPTGADNVIRVVGRALTADELYFCPSQDHQITVA